MQLFNKSGRCRAFSLLLFCSLPVSAAEINWSGFVSVVGGKTLSDDTEYDAGYFGYDGVYDNETSFLPESLIGLQGQTKINDKLRATLQLIARGGNDFDAEAEWAYITYTFNKNWSVNTGKFRIPLYYYSNFLDVAYAYHWIRPPTAVYAGPSSVNGVDFHYKNLIGDYSLSSHIWYGNSEVQTPGGVFKSNPNMGITLQLEADWWSIRGVHHSTDLGFSPQPGVLIESRLIYQALSFFLEKDSFKFISEVIRAEFDEGPVLEDWNSWYASAAYSIGDFTPHITYTNQGQSITFGNTESGTTTVGIRWDFNPSAAFKLDYVSQSFDEVDNGSTPDDIDLISFGIDVLF